MGENIQEVTDSNFDSEVLQADRPVLVDFWAPWCGPCRMLAPTIDDVAEEFGSKAKIVKMNVDHNPDTPFKYNIKGIPTLLLFKEGVVQASLMGAKPRDEIARLIRSHL